MSYFFLQFRGAFKRLFNKTLNKTDSSNKKSHNKVKNPQCLAQKERSSRLRKLNKLEVPLKSLTQSHSNKNTNDHNSNSHICKVNSQRHLNVADYGTILKKPLGPNGPFSPADIHYRDSNGN